MQDQYLNSTEALKKKTKQTILKITKLILCLHQPFESLGQKKVLKHGTKLFCCYGCLNAPTGLTKTIILFRVLSMTQGQF